MYEIVTLFAKFRVLHTNPCSMRRWYGYLVGISRKASSQLFEGVFQSEIPRVGRRGERGRRESVGWRLCTSSHKGII
jgi:hypothetical protein